ncbi:hypothetical protein MHUMG1_02967 [Metarhizium humberi]|uniref:Uncharacterized protein n=1 Tax=Metarhizium humberi TaxID=2596975 RepID=A0A9P8MHZ3_9HYPO|nr:hypothetical protein MHUMG1_02967 [Metarhizium humberi]
MPPWARTRPQLDGLRHERPDSLGTGQLGEPERSIRFDHLRTLKRTEHWDHGTWEVANDGKAVQVGEQVGLQEESKEHLSHHHTTAQQTVNNLLTPPSQGSHPPTPHRTIVSRL